MSFKRENSPFSHDDFVDMDAFTDFSDNNNFIPSPRLSSKAALSSELSPAPPPATEDTSEFFAPSYPYNLHVQQTDVFGPEFGDMFLDPLSYLQLDTDAIQQTMPYFYTDQPVLTGTEKPSSAISPPQLTTTLPKLISSAPAKTNRAPVQSTKRPHPQQQQMRTNYYLGHQQEVAAYNQSMATMQATEKPSRTSSHFALKTQTHPQEQKIHAILNSFKPPLSSIAAPPKHQSELLPHIARLKKEEEEMDDDERLLASEEGKKLSSKERRQLRNKVSARAFRSRRKEYISQLEAEVAKKVQETDAAVEEARCLQEENTRLKEFAEMLMKHSAFQEFLNDMTVPLTNPSAMQQPPQINIEPVYSSERDQWIAPPSSKSTSTMVKCS